MEIMNQNFEWNRNVIRVKGTFYICIPQLYADANDIKKGQVLRLKLLEDGSLAIISKKMKQ